MSVSFTCFVGKVSSNNSFANVLSLHTNFDRLCLLETTTTTSCNDLHTVPSHFSVSQQLLYFAVQLFFLLCAGKLLAQRSALDAAEPCGIHIEQVLQDPFRTGLGQNAWNRGLGAVKDGNSSC